VQTSRYMVRGSPGGLTADEARALYLYSCEWEPREESLYYRLNASLRDRDRSQVHRREQPSERTRSMKQVGIADAPRAGQSSSF
jgi:hypothetical protein